MQHEALNNPDILMRLGIPSVNCLSQDVNEHERKKNILKFNSEEESIILFYPVPSNIKN